MSSAPPRIEDTEHSSKRQRLDEDGAPEDEKISLRKSLEDEHEAFKKKTKPLTEKLDRVDECMESFKKTIKPSFSTMVGGMAEYRNLDHAVEQAKAEIASLQQAPAQTARDETRRHNVIEMVEKHKYRITIPVTTHAQVMEEFQPLIASGNKEHVDHLLDFVFLAKVGKWYCFQEVCEKGALGLTEVRVAAECPLHGAGSTAPSPQVHHGPPALSIFLTNLNLLDLDQHQDWPGIRAQTFASGGSSAQGLKKRVHCVEWALFQLFALWDPDETKKKLKPFFPPLDQTQSVNLRAALLRALEQAKKNGVLGRDAIVRKTMLDECRGERLEEVLAAFSSAVLKHVIAQEVATSGEHTALALGLALEDRGYKSDNTDLNTMVLAHKVAISHILNSKVAANSRFRDFADLLNVKEKGIARRKEALDALEGGKTISEDARREMWRTLRNNWSGNERWMETLLYGDASIQKDGLLGMPFDRVWRRVQQGRLGELEEHSTGLLEQLDTRVRVQRERLQKWQTFRNRLSADQPKPSPSKVKQKEKENGIDFGFGAHEALHLGSASPKKAAFGKPKLLSEYQDLVSNLSQELQGTKPQKSSALDFLQRPASQNTPAINAPAPEPQEEEEEAISELEDEDGFAETPIQSFKSKLDKSRRLPVRPKLAHTDDSFASVSSRARNLRKPSEDEARILRASSVERTSSPEPEDEPVAASPRPEYDVSPQLSPHISPQPSPPPSPLPLQESPELMPSRPSPTQEMADQILESMDMASPSPVKRRPKPRHTLSLAERTRLTMARGAFDPDNEDIDISPPTSSEPVSAEDPSQTSVDEEFDLIARTRKSMAGFDKARQKAQLDRRRSLRKTKAPPKKEGSYFPKVEEEDMTIITDELMAQEDMEAVFRSRPKIKASPLPSPTKDWDDDEYM
ncbi:hypothetical protein FPCIR_10386 [Fusarium pseudocircinatum]|uniref:HAUS augmin-like complex subunit 6 N-terminal domain-containing protein n=1 Tax=Fusarium pseudocircinatum TaxID=56676 RepID=A0A8H5KYC6_9HYPO|nr:hypothetical protein FPCIR_10386 [Fusarium pseudocircinatum]